MRHMRIIVIATIHFYSSAIAVVSAFNNVRQHCQLLPRQDDRHSVTKYTIASPDYFERITSNSHRCANTNVNANANLGVNFNANKQDRRRLHSALFSNNAMQEVSSSLSQKSISSLITLVKLTKSSDIVTPTSSASSAAADLVQTSAQLANASTDNVILAATNANQITTQLFSIQRSILLCITSITTMFTKMRQGTNLLATSILSLIKNQNRRTMTKSIFKLVFIFITIYSMIDFIQTKKRQSVDETSEWGRYADYPSLRAIALFALMGKISFFMAVTRIIDSLPGGQHPLFTKNKNDIAADNNIDSNAVLETSKRKENPESNSNAEVNSWAIRKATQIRQYSGNKLADGLLRLGPLYIKIGQIISCRDNLLPNEWKVALEKLQDRVPAKSGQEALDLAYQAYDGDRTKFHSVFSEFDDVPLAAASLGQVHRARLKSNNATVAIKLQRSRLRDIYDKDLTLMNKIAKAVDNFAGKAGQVGGAKQSWKDIFKDAETILYREIDYRDEAQNAMRFASDFGLGVGGSEAACTSKSLDGKTLPSAASWIRTPFIYDEFSTEKLLVMEYVPSIKISENAKLDAAGVSFEDKEFLAECLARAYLRQLCVNKFFSTDPHPGNLGVEMIDQKGKGATPRLVFYDFGQACGLQDEQSGGILDVIEGIVDTNVDNCVHAFSRMGVLVDGADLDKVRTKVRKNFETGLIKVKSKKRAKRNKNQEKTSEKILTGNMELENEEINSTLVNTSNASNSTRNESKSSPEEEDVNDAEIMTFFTLPAEYAFVARAISQLDGVGKGLDADFDFISASAPYLVEIKGGERYIADELKKFVAPVLKWQIDIQKRAGYNPIVKKKPM